MKNTQNKTVELYNRNSDYYWNVEKFVTEQGYSNVCEYCYKYYGFMGTWCIRYIKDINGGMITAVIFYPLCEHMHIHSYNAAYSQLQNVNDNSCVNPCY